MKTTSGRTARVAALGFLIAALSACSHETPAEIVVLLTNAPATLTINQSVHLTANIINDSSDAGLDWSCSGGSCGTFAPGHTANRAATVYTAPATPGLVTVRVASTADAAVADSAQISIVPIGSNAMLDGTYVFSVQGADSSGGYTAAGTIVADGDGNITAGQQDYSDETLQAGPDAVTGTYAIGPDGRGSITLTVANTNLPNNGVETFSVAMTSGTHALIGQFDGTATSSGSLDAQTASALDPAAIAGAFAFTAQGVDLSNQVPLTHGGVVIMSAATGTISGGTYFENDGGFGFSATTTGTLTAPDAFGRGTIDLSVHVTFAYYAVQGQVLRLIEKDLPTIMTGGSMFGQGVAGVGQTFSEASLNGSYVLSHAGGTGLGALAVAGQFTADGAGNFTDGTTDLNNAGVGTFASISGQSRYTMAANGAGSIDLPPAVDQLGDVTQLLIFAVDPALNLLDPSSAIGGGGALVMDYDTTAVATGYIVPQTAGTFDGNFAFNLQFVASSGENDWIGQAAASAGALAGTVDINVSGQTTAGAAFTGAFEADASRPGRWTGTFTAGGVTHNLTYYQVSGAALVAVDLDGTDIGIALLQRQAP
jgi:hypothetical protein